MRIYILTVSTRSTGRVKRNYFASNAEARSAANKIDFRFYRVEIASQDIAPGGYAFLEDKGKSVAA
jgi:hypothetical protein